MLPIPSAKVPALAGEVAGAQSAVAEGDVVEFEIWL